MASPVRVKVCLVACGSFNPITNMHLRLFELARDSLNGTGRYEVVGGVISPVNDAYGKKGLISSSHRVEMCALATKSSDWIKVDDWEASQSVWSTTRVAMDHLAKSYGSAADGSPVSLKLLCGADLLESFAVPDLWATEDLEILTGHYGLAVITRAGSNPEKFVHESDALYKNRNKIHIATEWISNEISSTQIRRAIRRCNSVRYLIPDSVLEYIQANGLYQATSQL